MPVERRVHGDGGAYVAGEWIDIEDCAEQFNVAGGSCDSCSAPCPRSRSRTSAAKGDGSYDVVIVGAGCIGAAVARELAKTTSSVLVLEAADDVTQGATKGNSGIVHAGFDDKPGSVRSKYCWAGNQMFAQLDRELHFGFQRNGSLVVAKGAEDEATLKELEARGETNGVRNLRIIDQAELREMEPHIHPDATAALWSPDAGTVVPYEYAIALAENAADNGVEFRIRREVVAIEVKAAAAGGFVVTARQWDTPEYIAHQKSGLKRMVAAIALLAPAVAIAFCGVTTVEALLAAAPLLSMAADEVGHFGVQVGLVLVAVCYCASVAYVAGASPKSLAPVGSGGQPIKPGQMADGGSGSSSVLGGATVATETIRCSYVVNCAGAASDKIAAMVGDTSFKIKPRLGEYLLLNKDQGPKANATLFPAPGPLGKGVLVQGTLWGNLILGPTARDVHNPMHMAETTDDITGYIIKKCKDLVPSFDPRDVIHAFAGACLRVSAFYQCASAIRQTMSFKASLCSITP
jgi:L-2-hydroxyglutarate oxidase LhgO